MRSTPLGRSGLTVPSLTLGTLLWGGRTDEAEARSILRSYLEAGGTLVDTAHGYGDGASEEILGHLLGELPAGTARVCTKAGISRASGERVVDVSRGSLMDQLDTSLRRLGRDHVDLWLVHTWSEAVPFEETLSALEWAHRSGRARYVGVSNHAGWQLARAVSLAERDGIPLVADEVEYSLLEREPEHEVVPAASALGVGLMAWAPLGGGILAGRYRTTTPADSRAAQQFGGYIRSRLGEDGPAVAEAVATAARGLSTTPATVALAWLLARAAVSSAVVGPRTETQLRQLFAADALTIPAEVVAALDEVSSVRL
ncbi:Aldo/keto reductase [Nostocoides japonicum T1-X7]|uniref:Aldo/keto reductase n=1 Tax=Nostocoides japonicum T1-X7 TaxID=1194083 RepID=A0A077LWS8_9MICO|nr:aldo/keto reductase [Tetrasphaera japonica]CCH76390.1 Aldo/keto reductase [Tetrasphaera japonica T1-X7]